MFFKQLVDAEADVAAGDPQIPIGGREYPEKGAKFSALSAKSLKKTTALGSSSTPSCSFTARSSNCATSFTGEP
jgi:hypothetical protein